MPRNEGVFSTTTSEWGPRTREILTFVGLEPFLSRRAIHLSGGMKQKLGLAAALVHRPKILLLDEPTRGVDPVTRQDFWQLIIRLVNDEGVAILISTTYMDEATRCSRVGFLQHGQLRVESSPDALRDRLTGQIVELRVEEGQLQLQASVEDREGDMRRRSSREIFVNPLLKRPVFTKQDRSAGCLWVALRKPLPNFANIYPRNCSHK